MPDENAKLAKLDELMRLVKSVNGYINLAKAQYGKPEEVSVTLVAAGGLIKDVCWALLEFGENYPDMCDHCFDILQIYIFTGEKIVEMLSESIVSLPVPEQTPKNTQPN